MVEQYRLGVSILWKGPPTFGPFPVLRVDPRYVEITQVLLHAYDLRHVGFCVLLPANDLEGHTRYAMQLFNHLR